MPSVALRPSGAVASLFRAKRKEMGLTLAEVCTRLAAAGEPVPVSTLSRIEQGKFDPGVRRLHALIRVYNIPPHLVADLVELEGRAAPEPKARDVEALYREGLDHWTRGDAARGLACFFAIRKLAADGNAEAAAHPKAALAFAIAARNLGKYRLAKQILDDLLCEPLDRGQTVRALVLGASIWRGLGSIEMAFALSDRAERLRDRSDRKLAAFVRHQHAKLYLEAGRTEEAEAAWRDALRHYRAVRDPYGEGLARILGVAIAEALHGREAALKGAKETIRFARRHGHERTELDAVLELGRVQLRAGAKAEAIKTLREALAQAVRLEDKNGEFLAHARLRRAYEAAGEIERARLELEAARYFVRFVDDTYPEADEIRAGMAS